jgi:outer membrane biosynthesis protein TonB
MKKIPLFALVISLGACSTTTRTLSHDTAGPRSGLSFAESTDASPMQPTLVSRAELPTADRIGPELGAQKLAATVRICVMPNGETESVVVEQGSGIARFDRAVERDVASWKHEAFRAPAHVRVCKPLTLVYAPR